MCTLFTIILYFTCYAKCHKIQAHGKKPVFQSPNTINANVSQKCMSSVKNDFFPRKRGFLSHTYLTLLHQTNNKKWRKFATTTNKLLLRMPFILRIARSNVLFITLFLLDATIKSYVFATHFISPSFFCIHGGQVPF